MELHRTLVRGALDEAQSIASVAFCTLAASLTACSEGELRTISQLPNCVVIFKTLPIS